MKFLKYISLALVLSLLLAACGGQPQGSTGNDGSQQEDMGANDQAQAEDKPGEGQKPQANEPGQDPAAQDQTPEKITIVLDWVPNTNHTGLFVAKDKGYFAEEGLEVEIVQPAEDSSSAIVGAGRAEFGIYFQPNMVKRLLKDTPITAVAAILQHNTGGIMSLAEKGIKSPKDMAGKRYSTWEDPIDDATIQFLVEKDGGKWAEVQLIPGESTSATNALQLNLFDSIFVFQGWDYVHSQIQNVDTDFFLLTDYEPTFDYYTPVIIANDTFLAEKPEVAKRALRAIKKGYEFAVEDPAAAAEILIQNAPEGDADLIRVSQEFLSSKYIDDAPSWGVIDPDRWNNFYKWLYEKELISDPLTDRGFSNDYLE